MDTMPTQKDLQQKPKEEEVESKDNPVERRSRRIAEKKTTKVVRIGDDEDGDHPNLTRKSQNSGKKKKAAKPIIDLARTLPGGKKTTTTSLKKE